MKHRTFRYMTVLTLAATILLVNSASALFGFGEKNQAEVPTVGAPVAEDMEVNTYEGVACKLPFSAVDAEGDPVTFAITEQPKKGRVSVEGTEFLYTPEDGESGKDIFLYTATDSNGNISSPAQVTVTIQKNKSGVMYSDTEASYAAMAQCLAEEGIFVGAKIGEQYYFEPDREVTRSEFLAMVLETAGREVSSVTMTGFCDDAAIPVWAKAYAAAGVADGLVLGKTTENGAAFFGEDTITFNEAATILNRALDMGDVDLNMWYTDRDAVPTWAAQAVGNMEALNVLETGSFGSGTMENAICRADAAQMLSAVKTLLEGERTREGGFWSWWR